MKHILLLCCLSGLKLFGALPQSATPDDWNLAQFYQASTYVFYGEVTKVLPAANYKPGASGVYIHDIDKDELPLEAIVWPKARELSFAVTENLKGQFHNSSTVHCPDPNMKIWNYVQHDNGNVFLVKPERPGTVLTNLSQGDRGLFFIRYYWGSQTPIIYQARLGLLATDDLAILQAYQSSGKLPLEVVVQQAQAQKQAEAAQEALKFRALEDDYYKILRIQELEIRRSLLNDLIERMGFQGLWTFFEFKERYLQQYGAYISEDDVPSVPLEGKEKLWHDISSELTKIDFILKARTGKR